MSWLQKNSFLFALSGITLLGVAVLFYYGTRGNSRYEAAKLNFDEAVAEATSMEKIVPYPTAPNKDGKKKAIDDFKKDVESLQKSFAAFRPGELQMVSPEKFIDRLMEVQRETSEVFETNAVIVPEAFFCGFRDYTGKLPAKSSTGILGYQLEAIRVLLLALAQSGATELKNLHRPTLDEESGLVYQPAAEVLARPLSLELTFKGSERSVRKFITELANTEKYYWVIRSLRISNMKTAPPKTADAKFSAQPAAKQPGNVFDGVFEAEPEPIQPPVQEGEATAPPALPPAPPAEPIAAGPAAGGDRILALILGSEELVVHLRLDLMMFLEPKPLP